MAILKLEDDTILTDINDIGQELAPLNIQLNCWAVGDNRELHRLLPEDSFVETSNCNVSRCGFIPQLGNTAFGLSFTAFTNQVC
ncbi:MAG: hypothetical protein RMZ69_02305 [Nostoc sp. ChiQUE01a]|nr:hypothetical protein [Nostoc sp. ChiQUE01a]